MTQMNYVLQEGAYQGANIPAMLPRLKALPYWSGFVTQPCIATTSAPYGCWYIAQSLYFSFSSLLIFREKQQDDASTRDPTAHTGDMNEAAGSWFGLVQSRPLRSPGLKQQMEDPSLTLQLPHSITYISK